MKTENLNPEESLNIIQQTIQRARGKFSDISIYFVFWGWLVLAVCLFNYLFISLKMSEYAQWIWMLMPIGGAITGFIGYKQGKPKQYVSSFIDKYISGVWTGFFIALILTLYVMISVNFSMGYFILILIMAWATLTTGHVIDFFVMRLAGLVGFGLALASLFVPFPEKQLLLASAMLIIYIIPGHLLRNYVKKQNTDS
jgi:dolichol kinase